ncbi:hypothetical protein ACYZX9_17165 [Sphingomonas citri]
MSDLPPNRNDDAGTRAEKRAVEAAAIRRRWITLGEVLALAAVLISALTLWSNWSDRRDDKVAKAEESTRASSRAATLTLVASAASKDRLTLRPAAEVQSVQSQTLLFPSALGLDPVETTGEPRIEGDWFEGALKKARAAAHRPDDSRGDEQMPVAIVTRYLVDGAPHEDVALYDIGYSISGHLFSGHSISLRGLSLVTRVPRTSAQARLDARWTKLLPSR